jgi:hypothetical protein
VAPLGRHRAILAPALAAAALLVAPASGATASCPKPSSDRLAPELTSPCAGARLKAGHDFFWRVTDTNANARKRLYYPFLNVTRSRPRHGILPDDASGQGIYAQMRAVKGHPGRFSYEARRYSFRGYWLVTKGTWYVQVQQVDGTAPNGTRRYSPVEKVTIR